MKCLSKTPAAASLGKRLQSRAAILLAAFMPVACFAAPQWQLDSKVEVNGHNPQVTGGPAIASGGVTALAVYAGEGGKNIWYSYSGPSLKWQGNQPIKDGNADLTTDGRPAVTYVAAEGYFLMVIPGQRVFSTWKYPFGPWTPVDGHQDITELQFSEPALADAGDRTHLLICENNGNLLWYSKVHSYDGKGAWVNETRVASGTSPSMTTIGNTVHAIYWDTDQKAWIKLTLKPGAPSWESHRIVPNGQTPNRGAALTAVNGQLFIVYTANGNAMKFAALNADSTIGAPQSIAPNNHAAATDAAIGVAAMRISPNQTSLVAVHKGESSKNLWFATAEQAK